MIAFELFQNTDHNDCSYCGQYHKEMIQLSEEGYFNYHLIMGRRCAKKFIIEMEKFLKLNASGLEHGRKSKPFNSLQQGSAKFRAEYTNDSTADAEYQREHEGEAAPDSQ